ncbi:TolC family protein [Maribellus maritimus]|uniref:TolC family protein n=1 Tax=Maribellus maritimus TaxID=2870838 RepID=UPI001EEA9707|nr:TolC family protein [Maribellus maritimus]MCG6186744.1 TolC family protein [Maribellus maritimus]
MRRRHLTNLKSMVFLKSVSGFLKLSLITAITVGIFSCSPKTAEVLLPVAPPDDFSRSGDFPAPDKWWLAFNNERLNILVDSALITNFSLNSAWQRFRASQAILKRESSALFPNLSGSADAEVNNRQSEFQQSQRFRLGLYSEYEIDLWGRIGAGIEAQQLRTEAAFADYQTSALVISAEIVRAYFQLLEANNQLELAKEQVEINEKMLRLIKVRFGSGQVRSVDILRQLQLLEATREQQIHAESRVEVLEHQLAVLLGKTPQEAPLYEVEVLPKLPPLPETGIPSELIDRRPDIRSSFKELLAADRDLAMAISNRYPRITLSASVSTAAYDVEDLFQDWGRSLAGNLLAPIFQGKELNAEVDRAEALKRQRLYEYGETILNAFREVEDALIQEAKQAESIQSLEKQVEMTVKTNEQLRLEYLNGMSNYLDVLTALHDEQQLRRDLLSAKLMLIEYRIALYRSLAGGFETERQFDGLLDI